MSPQTDALRWQRTWHRALPWSRSGAVEVERGRRTAREEHAGSTGLMLRRGPRETRPACEWGGMPRQCQAQPDWVARRCRTHDRPHRFLQAKAAFVRVQPRRAKTGNVRRTLTQPRYARAGAAWDTERPDCMISAWTPKARPRWPRRSQQAVFASSSTQDQANVLSFCLG